MRSPLTKILIPILFMSLTSGCMKKSSSGTEPEAPQSPACESLNLVRDASWTSGFLRSFVNCLSSSDRSAGDKFANTLAVMDKLGDQGLQSTLDLVRFEHEGREVLFGAFGALLSRGSDSEDRWLETQAVLEDTRPAALFTLMRELNRQDLLIPVLDALAQGDAALPEGVLDVQLRLILSDDVSRTQVRELLGSLLADPAVLNSLGILFDPKPYVCEGCADTAAQSASAHWLKLWDGLASAQRDRLIKGLSGLLQGTLQQEDGVAEDRAASLAKLLVKAIARSPDISHQATDALGVMLDTPLESYQPFIEGLGRIKDNPLYSDAFQEKIGSHILQSKMEEFLWNGGQPASCQSAFAGMKEGQDEAGRRQILTALLNPAPACEGRTPALAALSEWLGYSCPASVCGLSLWAPSAAALPLDGLMKHYLTRSLEQLRQDPWTFYRLGASTRALNADTFAGWLESRLPRKAGSAQDLLRLEAEVYAAHRDVLSPDWLELSLAPLLLELGSMETAFQGLFPDRNPIEQWYFGDADIQMARVLFGAYTGGDGEQQLAQVYSFTALEADWFAAHPESRIDPRDLAQILAPLRNAAGSLRNPLASFKPDAEKLALPWFGNSRNVQSFTAGGAADGKQQTLDPSLLLNESEQGLSLLPRLREQLALATAALPVEEADSFRTWFEQTWIPARQAQFKGQEASVRTLPIDLFDKTPLSREEARMLPLFLAQQFERQAPPAGATLNSEPESNATPRAQAARSFYGSTSLTGQDHPWTGFWLLKSSMTAQSASDFGSWLNGLPADEALIRAEFSASATAPVLVSQGLLSPEDATKLGDHAKLLLQLNLASPILENRGRQYFVPAVGFAAYCPKKADTNWTATNCPMNFQDFTAYRSYLQTRVGTAYCSFPLLQKEDLGLGLNLSASRCQPYASVQAPAWLQGRMRQILTVGKNPKLKAGLSSLTSEMRWAKAQTAVSPKQILKGFLAGNAASDARSAAAQLARQGLYQSFFERLPSLSQGWILQLGQSIGSRSLSEKLKALGAAPIAGEEQAIQALFQLVIDRYNQTRESGGDTLAFLVSLIDGIAERPYARQMTVRLVGQAHDPYTGILLAYTLPQAVKAGILPSFSWSTYAPLRLLLQPQNLTLLQQLFEIYDLDALDWFDHWQTVSRGFGGASQMASDLRAPLLWLRETLSHGSPEGRAALRELALQKEWRPSALAFTTLYRNLRRPLLDLSNQWREPYYNQTEGLSRAGLESMPRLWRIMEDWQSEEPKTPRMAQAVLGLTQGVLHHEGTEVLHWFQDERLGFRAPSFWPASFRDPLVRAQISQGLSSLDQTDTSDWLSLQDEWLRLGPGTHRLMDYMATNIQLKRDEARYQKDALLAIASLTGNQARWVMSNDLFEAWLADEPVEGLWTAEKKP